MIGRIGRIVVGYDGSPQAERALDWAAAEASRRRSPLHVLYVLDVDRFVTGGAGGAARSPYLGLDSARLLVSRGVRRARAVAPGTTVAAEVKVGRPIAALVAATRRADLLVLGVRVHTRVRELAGGSVAAAVSAHGRCPVVLVHGNGVVAPGPGHPVVVGVKGPSEAALAHAVRIAAATSALLVLVRAWNTLLRDEWVGVDAQVLIDREDLLDWECRAARQDLDRALARVREHAGDLPLTAVLVEATPVDALLGAAVDPGVIVVGDSGRAAVSRLLFGSVAREVADRATQPVVVVPDRLAVPGWNPVGARA